MYALGIDLGTTYTAAATWRDGRVEIASLGSRGAAIPSVVLLRQDETFLTGETASRRALTEPERVAREFKRRLGDPTPILLGGVPYSAEALTSRLIRWVVDEVATREGGEPSAICVCHPANWGPFKMDLLRQAVRMTNLERPVTFTTEPEAAAVFYAQGRPLSPGAIVAVYDLGGGTFDAAVLRKTETGFAILGQPEGIERLGGIDFDAAVFNHVSRAIGDKLTELDEGDPAAVAAVARLREECVEAKEALSSDTDASIPVLLPNVSTEVRLTRVELEAMVRPALHESIDALRRALRSAAVTADQLDAVLLVGGSSRMPIVAQLVGAELGRPVAVDAHPKHAVALGAAWAASGAAGGAREARSRATAPQASGPAVSGPQVISPPLAPIADVPRPTVPRQEAAPVAASAAEPPTPAHTVVMPRAGSEGPAGGRPMPVHRSSSGGSTSRSRTPLLAVGGLAAAAAVGIGAFMVLGGGDENPGGEQAGNTSPAAQSPGGSQSPAASEPAVPADEQCTEEIMSNERWVCITSATISDGELTIEYEAEWAGSTPDKAAGFHVHFYGADERGEEPPAAVHGTHVSSDLRAPWYIEDQNPSTLSVDSEEFQQVIGAFPKVCARIANAEHELVTDSEDAFKTGNCAPIIQG